MINLCRDCICYIPDEKRCRYWGDYAGPSVMTCQARKPKSGSYISRDKLEQWIMEIGSASIDTDEDKVYIVERLKDDIPDADVIPAKRATWLQGVCMNCRFDWSTVAPIANVPNYCPNCGADMRGDFDES